MKRKALFSIAMAIVVAVLLETVAWLLMPASIEMITLPQDLENLYISEEYYLSGYDYSGSTFTPNNNDPQMGFQLPGRDIATAYIEFAEPLSRDMTIQVYFASNGDYLCEENHVDIVAREGARIVTAELPRNVYTHMRIDINGEFSLQGIYVDTEPPIITYQRGLPNFVRPIITCVILCFVFLLSFFDSAPQIVRVSICDQKSYGKLKKLFPICMICIMGILIGLQTHNSSMECFNAIIPNNIAVTEQGILGAARPIRSDEYLVSTPAFFHNNLNGQLAEIAFVPNGTSVLVWINNVITILNPYYWGELFLPVSYAFSWKFIFTSAFFIWTFYELFYIITRKKLFSIIASLLVFYSPAVQWWSIPPSYLLCGHIVLFYKFFEAEKKWEKCLFAWGLVCCTSVAVPIIYPAWAIPIAYLFVIILIAIYATERKFNFKKSDIPYILITIILMACVAIAYFISSADATQSMLDTVYPGKRFSVGGGIPTNYWSHYLTMAFTPWKTGNMVLNQSELSHFLHLFPIPIAIFAAKFREFRKSKAMIGLVGFNILCDIYMIWGIGNFAAKWSLLSYTTPERLHIIWGFSSFILLLLECFYIVPKEPREFKWTDWAEYLFVNGCIIAFLIWTFVTQPAIINYVERDNYIYISAGLLLLGNLLFFGKKKVFIMLMCGLTLISGVVVNPINFGTGYLTNTPLAKAIREIDQDNTGRWIALNDLLTSKYVYAQGVDCLNYLSWPPRFDLFEPIDEDREFYDIYNRYAHVVVNLTTEKTSFILNQADAISVCLNVNDLQKWDVKYIVLKGNLPQQIGNTEFELLYWDNLDSMNIYKVDYLT